MSVFDDVLREQDRIIAQIGWDVTAVVPEPDTGTSPFAYTIGLTAHTHPELVIASLHPAIAHGLLGDMARRVVQDGACFQHGQRIRDLVACYDTIIVEGAPTDDLYPGTAIARYGAGRVRLQQIVWPDPQGRFPWDPGYAYPPQAQPLLGRP